MTTLWIDATAGVAGDMLLGALIDAGAPIGGVRAAIDAVVPGAIELSTEQTRRGAMRARRARVVQVGDRSCERTWAAIRALLEESALHPLTRRRSLAVFEALARAEAKVHGFGLDEVHFHEVGGLDAIADVVGSCEAIRLLGVDEVRASWVALGNGRVRAAHGAMPVPVPAVLELATGWTVRALPAKADAADSAHLHEHAHDETHHHAHAHAPHPHSHEAAPGHEEEAALPADPRDIGELATPTGLALIRALAPAASSLPSGTPLANGVGAGAKDFPAWANVVRVVLIDEDASPAPTTGEAGRGALHASAPSNTDDASSSLVEIAANIDDLDHRLVPGVIDALLGVGALDAWATPIHMKKGRPALTISALVDDGHRAEAVEVLLTRTSTLGVRQTPIRRTVLDRRWRSIAIDLPNGSGTLLVKIGERRGRVVHAQAEWSSIAELARRSGCHESDLAQRAAAAIVAAGLVPGAVLDEHGTGTDLTGKEEDDEH
ncbi:MAG: LarC family nickel insertion protein [Schaalia hyovaginalis]|uniref:LarC family nickel insertion protein n=1 Tax=Schaalia hyovaginalis TaxID=29316 RepID=UPI002A91F02E|nr:LarC family nickel insertion protein [Schaalia hyovaginalis]MDY5601308.1 LarC family nickel insertion protein [Schaalia hyovaginalis]